MLHHKQNHNLNQRGADTIHDVPLMKYQNYPLKIMLKHANALAQVIKLHDVHLYYITPYKKCSLLKYMYVKLPY